MQQYPTQIQRALRELERELWKLDRSFAEWRIGSVGSGELVYRVHAHDTGPARELFKPQSLPRSNVSEHVRHDVAGEQSSKDTYDEYTQTILVIVQKGVAVLPL